MTDIRATPAFRSLTARTDAVLLTRGLQVEPTAVRGVLAHVVTVTAERIGLDEEEALHLVSPETVADLIVGAADERLDGAENAHAVRPVRVDARTVPADLSTLGRLVMAAAQAGKYAASNHDSRAATHLMDLATELGATLTADPAGNDGPMVPVGVLDELADHLDRTIARIEEAEWSICPCGEDHDQTDVDTGAAHTMRHDATLARNLRRLGA
ncbi:hypothetical protein GCM10027160_17690 [Streptomyces calidiresistens]|uniref:Uncharacterized protein n=1 Tax=Streptomyces calidiresistens TaxID=1485586 RepID=A0A7W3SZV6_9ACTN|nr:hypothetical protein [Streptomyces calidiresistens]MBB0228301.1 hypothetical protein [Streptomyces calidiresistens]